MPEEIRWHYRFASFSHAYSLLHEVLESDLRAAYKARFIEDGDAWMDMLTDRNRTSHKYDSDLIQDVVENISSRYFTVFTHLHETHNVGIVIYRRKSAEAI